MSPLRNLDTLFASTSRLASQLTASPNIEPARKERQKERVLRIGNLDLNTNRLRIDREIVWDDDDVGTANT